MRTWMAQVALLALLCGAMAASCFGQSVVEAAKQERARKSQIQHPAPVYTNDDLPKSPAATAPAAVPQQQESEAGEAQRAKSEPEAKQPEKPSAAEVRATVLAHKLKIRELEAHIADLQRQLDDWNRDWNSTHTDPFGVGPCPYGVYNNPYQDWCDIPNKLSAEADKTRAQLQQEQAVLEQLQEEARKMGFRSAVYDP